MLVGCNGSQRPTELSGATMGTTWHVSYLATSPALPSEKVEQGIANELEAVNRSMSTYIDDSEISRLNGYATHSWFETSPDFFHVLATALDVGRLSEGAYDVTVAPLVNLWGFGPGKPIDAPPDADAIAAAQQRVGQDGVRLDGDHRRVMKLNDLAFDFSSLAKGYAVDKVAEWLLAQGIVNFMVEVGGELRLSGVSGRGDAWRIAIEQPDIGGRSVAITTHVTDAAVATSGDYRNYFEFDGRRYSHIIDPRTGRPVAHDLVSVTVVHPSCMLADAWATALTVLGAERAMSVALEQGLAVYFIRRQDGGFAHSHTPLFDPFLAEAPP